MDLDMCESGTVLLKLIDTGEMSTLKVTLLCDTSRMFGSKHMPGKPRVCMRNQTLQCVLDDDVRLTDAVEE